jgi:hypothetical protein
MNRDIATNAAAVICPYCRSTNTELFSLFGQQLLTMQYYCQNCHTPFEYIKDDALSARSVEHGTIQHVTEQAVQRKEEKS